jgi:aminoglycoside phosphotransferase (APT) family kinase protein
MQLNPESEAVRRVLVDACRGIRVQSLRPGPSGYSSRMWIAETDEGSLLVRVPLRNRDAQHLRSMMVATRLASEAGVPTVRFRAFSPDSHLGPVLIQEYRAGECASEFLQRNPSQLANVASTVGHWIGLLHQASPQHYGSVLGVPSFSSWAEQVRARFTSALEQLADSALPQSATIISAAFEKAIRNLPPAASIALIHADLYFENVLVHAGSAACLLDFEHAYCGDRFADFGKIRELLFDLWPGSEEPFMRAYGCLHPESRTDGARLQVAIGLHELSQLAYFSRWQPDLVPVYRERLNHWLEGLR